MRKFLAPVGSSAAVLSALAGCGAPTIVAEPSQSAATLQLAEAAKLADLAVEIDNLDELPLNLLAQGGMTNDDFQVELLRATTECLQAMGYGFRIDPEMARGRGTELQRRQAHGFGTARGTQSSSIGPRSSDVSEAFAKTLGDKGGAFLDDEAACGVRVLEQLEAKRPGADEAFMQRYRKLTTDMTSGDLFVAAEAQWSKCMAQVGYNFSELGEPLNAFVQINSAGQPLSEADSKEQIEVALADWACFRSAVAPVLVEEGNRIVSQLKAEFPQWATTRT